MTSNEEYIRKNKIIMIDDDKNTKLHYAAALDNTEEIEKIIGSGQKLDPENYLGWTPLMMAVRNGKKKSIELLLNSGADATKKNKFGLNVFLICVTCGSFEIVERILNHLLCGGVSRQSLQRFFSPVSLAILFGHTHIFKYLLERSFDPNVATPLTGITPLMFAAAISNNKAMKRLIQYKADTTQKNYIGKTASEILRSRHHRNDDDGVNYGKKAPHLPVIIVSHPTHNSPYLQLTPDFTVTNGQNNTRRSSNIQTPNALCSPAVTPITQQMMIPQIFFGSNFTPNQFISPVPAFHSNTFLNTTISPSGAFVSPIPSQPMCHPNYV